jgi:hypothetical protein
VVLAHSGLLATMVHTAHGLEDASTDPLKGGRINNAAATIGTQERHGSRVFPGQRTTVTTGAEVERLQGSWTSCSPSREPIRRISDCQNAKCKHDMVGAKPVSPLCTWSALPAECGLRPPAQSLPECTQTPRPTPVAAVSCSNQVREEWRALLAELQASWRRPRRWSHV